MDAVRYAAPNQLDIVNVPIPEIQEDQVLIKVTCCGICGTDRHLAEGEFIGKFPLIPGHEIVGIISQIGSSVKGLIIGDRCVADNTILCDSCYYCRRGQYLLCSNFDSLGVTKAGGFAGFVAVHSKKVFKINNLTDEEATLVEPAACAIHGMDRLRPSVGVEAIIFGAGPTGIILAQLLKINGASKVVIVANKGVKTKIARDLEAGDEYIELDRENPHPQWAKLKDEYQGKFDIVIEATGSQAIATDSINFVRRGGSLLIYGVYSNADRVQWSPAKIFQDEITVIGSFAQTHCFPRAVAYLDSGKIKVKGMVTDIFFIKDFEKALEKLRSKTACKIALRP
ncbi:chaperonin 10-like protein [Crepidotus variabilis]|uniref:Chaperonin 10-like protein n=1 Tax=Crepidotus variabilis TaxID=179855 RepID=A0A9P6EJA4_9AGAR|nr:chaperonin 10-like protein [Crepidotus variabilis]